MLDEARQVVVVVNGAALQVQRAEKNITSVLAATSGLDIRVRRLEPHHTLEEGLKSVALTSNHVIVYIKIAINIVNKSNFNNPSRTNIYIYAVDPVTNSLIDMDTLQRALLAEHAALTAALGAVRVERRGHDSPRPAPRAPLRPLQLGVLLLGAALVLAALATALCIVCFKRNKRFHR